MLLHLALRTWVSGPRWRVSLRHHDPQRQNVIEAGSAIENAETDFAIELSCQTEMSILQQNALSNGRTDVVNLYIRCDPPLWWLGLHMRFDATCYIIANF